jgi:hypothetical protein
MKDGVLKVVLPKTEVAKPPKNRGQDLMIFRNASMGPEGFVWPIRFPAEGAGSVGGTGLQEPHERPRKGQSFSALQCAIMVCDG